VDRSAVRELTESNDMKFEHFLYTLAGLAGTALLVDRYYRHPTFGNGIRALLAALRFGEAF
jgi:hypothetical protein